MDKKRKSSNLFPYTDAIDTYVLIRRTHDEVHRYVSKQLAQWGLSVPKYGIVVHLYDQGSLTLSKLSQLIFSGNSNLTALVDRMERDGIVERLNSASDRRVKKIRLTQKGMDLAPKVISEYRGFLHQMMLNCLSPEEQHNLKNLLGQVKNKISSLSAPNDTAKQK